MLTEAVPSLNSLPPAAPSPSQVPVRVRRRWTWANRAPSPGFLLALGQQWQVGAAGVTPVLGPLRGAMAQQPQLPLTLLFNGGHPERDHSLRIKA